MPIDPLQSVQATRRHEAHLARRAQRGPATRSAARQRACPVPARLGNAPLDLHLPVSPAQRVEAGTEPSPWRAATPLQFATLLLLASQPVSSAINPRRATWTDQGRHAFLGPEVFEITTSPAIEAEILAESGLLGMANHALQAWFADPCTHPDLALNGLWQIVHPPREVPPSLFEQGQRALHETIIAAVSAAPGSPTGAARALADTWASGMHPVVTGWDAFKPRARAIDALAGMDDVERHICTQAAAAGESVVALYGIWGMGVLAANLGLLPAGDRALYALPADDPKVTDQLQQMGALLEHTGLDRDAARRQAPVVWAMEQHLAGASADFDEHDLASVRAAVPGFPWERAWRALGLADSTRVHVTTGFFAALAGLLRQHDVADWQAYLRLQEARNMREEVEHVRSPSWLLDQLDRPDVASGAVSACYVAAVNDRGEAALQRTEAEVMFEGVRQMFLDDIDASALPADDRQRCTDVLSGATLTVSMEGDPDGWGGTSPIQSLSANLQALRQHALRRLVDNLNAGTVDTASTQASAHRLDASANQRTLQVRMSLSLLRLLADSAGTQREAAWGRIGAILGHEVGHLLADVSGLTDPGQALMAAHLAAAGQRVGDLQLDGLRADPARIQDEALADLRGISAAYRAGRAEAQREGRVFDDRAFFTACVQTHAATLTRGQLAATLDSSHLPGPLRAELVAMVDGFERAFDCEPRPAAPYRHVI